MTEAVAVVGPMEVVKIRLQAQHHSMTDPLDIPKYRNAGHALFVILREEGFRTLYRCAVPRATMLEAFKLNILSSEVSVLLP